MSLKIIVIIAISIIASSECSRVLFLHPTFSHSHVLPLQVLAKILAIHGHEVTFVSLHPLDRPLNNYRDIKVEMSQEDKKLCDSIGMAMAERKHDFILISLAVKFILSVGNETLNSPAFRKLMETEQFDLLIIGYFFNDFYIGIADHFKCPSIVFFSGSFFPTLLNLVGNPLVPEAVQHPMINGRELTFLMRVLNYMLTVSDRFFSNVYFRPKSKALYS